MDRQSRATIFFLPMLAMGCAISGCASGIHAYFLIIAIDFLSFNIELTIPTLCLLISAFIIFATLVWARKNLDVWSWVTRSSVLGILITNFLWFHQRYYAWAIIGTILEAINLWILIALSRHFSYNYGRTNQDA
jgi:hypothetical protein